MGAEEIKEENSELAARIKACFGEENQDIRTYSPLTLAYIGDAIYDLVIRTVLVGRGNAPVNTLHREAQKASLHQIEPLLSEEEKSVYRRGRNAKSYTTAKNASVGDYRIATGFEALLGYLYLTGQMERLLYLVKAGLEGTEA